MSLYCNQITHFKKNPNSEVWLHPSPAFLPSPSQFPLREGASRRCVPQSGGTGASHSLRTISGLLPNIWHLQPPNLPSAALGLPTLPHTSGIHTSPEASGLGPQMRTGSGITSSFSFHVCVWRKFHVSHIRGCFSFPNLGELWRRTQAHSAWPLHLQTCLPAGAPGSALFLPDGESGLLKTTEAVHCRHPQSMGETLHPSFATISLAVTCQSLSVTCQEP